MMNSPLQSQPTNRQINYYFFNFTKKGQGKNNQGRIIFSMQYFSDFTFLLIGIES